MSWKTVWAIAALAVMRAGLASAEEGMPLRVLICEFPPLVQTAEDGQYSGFDIDLWEALVEEIGIETGEKPLFEYKMVKFHTVFDRLVNGEVDAAIAGITINKEREKRVDFSHQYLESGLRVLTRKAPKASIFSAVKTLFARDRMIWAVYLFIFIIICGHILWFSERGDDEAISNHYFRGILEAFWCVVATMTTVGFGDIAPRTWPGRFMAFCVMITGIAFFGIAIAQLTVGLTAQTGTVLIQSQDDLADRKIATVKGSTSVDFLKDSRSKVIEKDTVDNAVDSLEAGEAEAVVFDAPPLLKLQAARQNADLELVGEMFEKQHYGIAVPQGSPLREQINRALLGIRQNGVYDKLRQKWFGKEG